MNERLSPGSLRGASRRGYRPPWPLHLQAASPGHRAQQSPRPLAGALSPLLRPPALPHTPDQRPPHCLFCWEFPLAGVWVFVVFLLQMADSVPSPLSPHPQGCVESRRCRAEQKPSRWTALSAGIFYPTQVQTISLQNSFQLPHHLGLFLPGSHLTGAPNIPPPSQRHLLFSWGKGYTVPKSNLVCFGGWGWFCCVLIFWFSSMMGP